MTSKRIVVGVDGSEGSMHAVRWCVAYGSRGHEVIAVHAVPIPAYSSLIPVAAWPSDDKALMETLHETAHTQWCAPLTEGGVKYDALVVEGSAPWMLMDVADREDADMIVVGSRSRFGNMLLGSTTHQLSHHTRRPLVVVPPQVGESKTARRIFVAVDGSHGSDRALRWGIDFAKETDAEITAVHVLDLPWNPLFAFGSEEIPEKRAHEEHLSDEFEREWCRPLEDSGVRNRKILAEGDPAQSILDAADDHFADMIVVGSRGRGGFAELLLGSVSHKVVHHANIPVVIIPPSGR